MNYYAARELADGGGWHFTVKHDQEIRAVGCCAEPGHRAHATREEAEDCFNDWLLDGWAEVTYSEWHGCQAVVDGQVCDSPTKIGLSTRRPYGHDFALCRRHRDVARLRELAPRVSTMIASW